jgi:hypothetical protein
MPRYAVLLPVVIAFLVGAVPALAWTWPVDGPVLQQFTFGDDPYAGGQHRGIDVGASPGTPVLAPSTGTISFSGSVPGGGRTVTIQTGDGYAVTLQHLAALGPTEGEVVVEGQRVATVGAGGEGGGQAHVHLGIRRALDPNGYVDPLSLLPPNPSAGVAAPDRTEPSELAEAAGSPEASSADAAHDPGSSVVAAPAPAGENSTPSGAVTPIAEELTAVQASPAAADSEFAVASPGGSVVTPVSEPGDSRGAVRPRPGPTRFQLGTDHPERAHPVARAVPHRPPGDLGDGRRAARERAPQADGTDAVRPQRDDRASSSGSDRRVMVGAGSALRAPSVSPGHLFATAIAGAFAVGLSLLAWFARPSAGRVTGGPAFEPDPGGGNRERVAPGRASSRGAERGLRGRRGGPRGASAVGRRRVCRAPAHRPYDGPQ